MKLAFALPVIFTLALCQGCRRQTEFPQPPASEPSVSSSPLLSPQPTVTQAPESIDRDLESELAEIAETVDGSVGIGVKVLAEGQAAYLDRHGSYPMLSVHKLPIAMSVLKIVDEGRIRLDQEVSITPDDFVRPGYNSPLRSKHPQGVVLPLRDIIRASISESDGTASDVLLDLAGGPDGVQNYLSEIGVGDAMVITESEKSMSTAWEMQYRNWATPESTVELLQAIQERRAGLSEASTQFLLEVMRQSETGERRVMGGLPMGTQYAHKTGTGGTEKGITSATNDVGIITLPDGRHIAIAVYIRDSKSSTAVRLKAMQKIAEAVWKKWAGNGEKK